MHDDPAIADKEEMSRRQPADAREKGVVGESVFEDEKVRRDAGRAGHLGQQALDLRCEVEGSPERV